MHKKTNIINFREKDGYLTNKNEVGYVFYQKVVAQLPTVACKNQRNEK